MKLTWGPRPVGRGLCRLVDFWLFPGGWGGEGGGLRMQGSAGTCPFPRPGGPPTPSCSICVQRAKCPPFPQKKGPPMARENGGGGAGRGRMGASLSPKARIQIKKYNIIIIIIIIIHKCNRQWDTEHEKGGGERVSSGRSPGQGGGGEIVNSSSGRLREGEWGSNHHFNVCEERRWRRG